jgi:hypothetical protein
MNATDPKTFKVGFLLVVRGAQLHLELPKSATLIPQLCELTLTDYALESHWGELIYID